MVHFFKKWESDSFLTLPCPFFKHISYKGSESKEKKISFIFIIKHQNREGILLIDYFLFIFS